MGFLRESLSALKFLKYLFTKQKVSVVIPCFNEESTVSFVVKESMKSALVSEVIVVDDGSSDNSASVAESAGARVIRHEQNKGKGSAIISGAKAAKEDVVVFIDADFQNLSYSAIEALAMPVIYEEAKLCKAAFDREGGRVTELVAKPLLEFFFPQVNLEQPLSGQFAVKKDFLLSLDLDPGWGIDLGIVLESIKKGERIIEVNIGPVEHKHRSLDELAETSRSVMRTILQKSGFLASKHKLIIFDFDRTLIRQRSIDVILGKLGFGKDLEKQRSLYLKGKISERELTVRIARLLRGISSEKICSIASGLKKSRFADETLAYLKRRGYKLAVISFAFKRVICSCFPGEIFDDIICPTLLDRNRVLTGKVRIPSYDDSKHLFSKGRAVKALMRKFNASKDETIAVGDSPADEDMFKEVGLAVVINPCNITYPAFKINSLSELIVLAN